ncbi:MAG TPA: adenylosuccinate synthetase, partial [bacterium]|nr:adenylosuccinate synthetase [bacterium]
MPAIVLVGAQWGDEGKGKITDMLAEGVDVIARYQGGNNAGHTVIVGEEEYILHLIPSGILYEDKICIIGDNVVIDPIILLEEIEKLEARGVKIDNLRISGNAHLIMPYHKVLDEFEEGLKGKHKIGTTKRGIGPAYVDKMSRVGLRVSDLFDKEEFEGRLGHTLKYKNLILREIFKHKGYETGDILNEYHEYGQRLKKYVADTSLIVYNALREDKIVLFEGAQGTLLDITHGTYPFVTSSHPVSGGACVGVGIGPNK